MNRKQDSWREVPLKHLAILNPDVLSETTDPDYRLAYVDIGSVNLERGIEAVEEMAFAAAPSRARRRVRHGDTIVSTVRTYLRAIAPIVQPPENLIVSTGFAVVRPRAGLDSRFLSYALRSNRFVESVVAESVGVSYPAIAPTKLGSLSIWIGPLSEQRAIADFLDGEVAKIDALIAKQEELIRQIGEKRAADIRAALTHGFRAGVRLRSSGVDWVGDVPAHWKVARLGSQATIVRGASPRPAGDPKYFGSTFCPWITVASITGGRGKYASPTDEFLTPEGAGLSRHIPANTLLLSNSGYSLGIPRITPFSGCINDGCLAIWPHVGPKANDYYYYVLEQMTKMLRERLKQGNDQPNLNTDLAKSIMVPVPPLDEMIEISSRLDTIFEDYERLRSKASEFIGRLQERRSTLITAAVTGQLAIGAAAQSDGPAKFAANDNRQAMRAAVGAEIVSRHGSSKAFGRVKLQKLLYLAEAHAGIHELVGTYTREAAGPLARELLSDAERSMMAAGYYTTVPPIGPGDGYTYSRIGKAGAHSNQLAALLGKRTAALSAMIDLLKDYDTRQVEAITTLYAVWNDALLDGVVPSEDRIIRGVLEEWHPEKREKFTAADLRTWLAWMKRNGLVPIGQGPRTQIDRLFV